MPRSLHNLRSGTTNKKHYSRTSGFLVRLIASQISLNQRPFRQKFLIKRMNQIVKLKAKLIMEIKRNQSKIIAKGRKLTKNRMMASILYDGQNDLSTLV